MPIKQISRRRLKRFSKPRITQGIRDSITTKNKLFPSGDKTKDKCYWNKINHLIRIFQLVKEATVHDYFEKKFNEYVKDLGSVK